MFTTKTSLIVPTKNRSLKIIKLLKSILKLKIKFNEIIIVDSSNKNHKEALINYIKKKKIKLIFSRPSTTHQRNIGLKFKKKTQNLFYF